MKTIGRYKIINLLGEGGAGKVYLAEDPYLGCQVAIKILSSPSNLGGSSNPAYNRFIREARTLAQITHPNIIRIFDISPESDPPFMSMEYVNGWTLSDVITKNILNSQIKKITCLINIVNALKIVHQAGIVHRDIKPSNIMLDPSLNVKIMDFGIIKDLNSDQALTTTETIIGTPCYISPEQINGDKVDYQSDIFLVGIIMYEVFTGKNPLLDQTIALTLKNVLTKNFITDVNLAQQDSELRNIITKALHKNKSERYIGCDDLLKDLKNYQAKISEYKEKKSPHRKSKIVFTFSLIFLFLATVFYFNTRPPSIFKKYLFNEKYKTPYYFISVQNTFIRESTSGEATFQESFKILKEMITNAENYNIRLTLHFSPHYLAKINPDLINAWNTKGHEIAALHISPNMDLWDGYTNTPSFILDKLNNSAGPLLGNMNAYMDEMQKYNKNTKSGCMNEEMDKQDMPDQILYSTCSGYSNQYASLGKIISDQNPEKAINEFILSSLILGKEKKWLSHAFITDENQIKQVEQYFQNNHIKENPKRIIGTVFQSIPPFLKLFNNYIAIINTLDPHGNQSRTVTSIIEEKLIPLEKVSIPLTASPNTGSIPEN